MYNITLYLLVMCRQGDLEYSPKCLYLCLNIYRNTLKDNQCNETAITCCTMEAVGKNEKEETSREKMQEEKKEKKKEKNQLKYINQRFR